MASSERLIHIKRQKNLGRQLRKSQWWQRQIQKGVCYYCHAIFSAKDLTMDHVIPLSEGGESKKGNVVPACKKCNTEKKDQSQLDWQNIWDKIKS